MSQEYREEDGMDPGLGDLAYDGTEYELDEFGERISDDDLDDDMPEEAMSEDDMSPASNVEEGFGETLNADTNPHLDDQFEDETLKKEAESDYNESDAPRS
jgi:hypothetical protein